MNAILESFKLTLLNCIIRQFFCTATGFLPLLSSYHHCQIPECFHCPERKPFPTNPPPLRSPGTPSPRQPPTHLLLPGRCLFWASPRSGVVGCCAACRAWLSHSAWCVQGSSVSYHVSGLRFSFIAEWYSFERVYHVLYPFIIFWTRGWFLLFRCPYHCCEHPPTGLWTWAVISVGHTSRSRVAGPHGKQLVKYWKLETVET